MYTVAEYSIRQYQPDFSPIYLAYNMPMPFIMLIIILASLMVDGGLYASTTFIQTEAGLI